MPQKKVQGAKALFWYLTLFFTLNIVATSVGTLWFQFINSILPLEVAGTVYQPFSQTTVKLAIAALIVATPLFYLFSILVRKALTQGVLEAHNRVKVWITYVILFIAIAIGITDLITTVFRMLDGDFTARFLLKSLTILTIVGWVFIYYALELKSDKALVGTPTAKAFGIVSLVVIVASFVGAFFLVDSPVTARAKAYDQTRINNLQELSYAINNYYTQNQALPETLDVLENSQFFVTTTDPQTNEPYEYILAGAESFELCANFETANTSDTKNTYPGQLKYDIGRNCFEYKITGQFPGSVEPVLVPTKR